MTEKGSILSDQQDSLKVGEPTSASTIVMRLVVGMIWLNMNQKIDYPLKLRF